MGLLGWPFSGWQEPFNKALATLIVAFISICYISTETLADWKEHPCVMALNPSLPFFFFYKFLRPVFLTALFESATLRDCRPCVKLCGVITITLFIWNYSILYCLYIFLFFPIPPLICFSTLYAPALHLPAVEWPGPSNYLCANMILIATCTGTMPALSAISLLSCLLP